MIIVKPKADFMCEELASTIEEEIAGVKALTDKERNAIIEPLIHETELWNLGLKTALYSMSLILVTLVAMMNMFERRRNFATLYAIGASKTFIIRIVITETSLIGLLGGLFGLILGALGSILMVSFYTNIPFSLIFPDVLTIVPPSLMAEILISVIALGSIAGVVPALIATKANIAERLRGEF
jgi:putative ABC transport system permease protein